MRPPQRRGGNPNTLERGLQIAHRFNEAPPAKGGKYKSLRRNDDRVKASMRPPQRRGGNEFDAWKERIAKLASMRPPQRRGGNSSEIGESWLFL